MSAQQECGRFRLEVWTAGSPLWPRIHTTQNNGDQVELCLGPGLNDLHDLRYCIDRVLAQLPDERGKA